ncbi:PaaI family thioesterase [Dyadobacter sp. CY312]|uniref:PaaI family thioesterase n=1 Tax=Dyadobacter sp. CY312 TaxID=2907303 RepID=UPI001F2E3C6A|nr:PaaI family thioesterase [Dyadobacter sp. CY312]MCE7041181.1 PaaI family thioesterase [Dyadobacter sp. CY312]
MSDSRSTEQTNENKRLTFLKKYIGANTTQSISPVGRWLNGKLLEISEGYMKAEFVVREDMTNPMGVLHGGIASTILDDVVGTMVYALGRDFAYTSVNLNCDFLHAARLNDVIVASANVIRAGKNIIHVEGLITNAEGKIIAKCTSNLIQTSLKIPS